ncbi:MAG: SDR family oxidoreductase [Acidobacteria bacterium]|nr:SDR family oxidoreductase [Acidobacteriota bacterium]
MALPPASRETTVLITGASSGIGAELARELAGRGHGVTLVARRADRLEELARELEGAYGVTAAVVPCDLADADAREKLMDGLADGPALVGLCNNAGFGMNGLVSGNDAGRERQMVELNVDALHDLTLRALPGMLERGTGAILNVASTAAFQPLPYFATYGATKAFVLSFTEGLSYELGGTGVSCTALCPGPVKTEFAEVAGSAGFEDAMPSFAFVDARDVARAAVEGMVKGSRTVIPGKANWVQAQAGRISPRAITLRLSEQMGRGAS